MTAVRLKSDVNDDNHSKSSSEKKRVLRLLIMMPILGILLFLLLGFTHNFIPSESMEPNLRPGDHILTMRSWLAYPGGAMPSRGDIIVFRLPLSPKAGIENRPDPGTGNGTVEAATRSDDKSRTDKPAFDILIKRVIGLPGDTVQVVDNDVYVNNKKVDEPYSIVPIDATIGFDFPFAVYEPLVVPPGEIFVLGDNRNNSDDGRFWGTLKRADVLGRFVRKLYHESKYDANEAAVPTIKR